MRAARYSLPTSRSLRDFKERLSRIRKVFAVPDPGLFRWILKECDRHEPGWRPRGLPREGVGSGREALSSRVERALAGEQAYPWTDPLPERLRRVQARNLRRRWEDQRHALLTEARRRLFWLLLLFTPARSPTNEDFQRFGPFDPFRNKGRKAMADVDPRLLRDWKPDLSDPQATLRNLRRFGGMVSVQRHEERLRDGFEKFLAWVLRIGGLVEADVASLFHLRPVPAVYHPSSSYPIDRALAAVDCHCAAAFAPLWEYVCTALSPLTAPSSKGKGKSKRLPRSWRRCVHCRDRTVTGARCCSPFCENRYRSLRAASFVPPAESVQP